jgi:hypothetical protein
VTTHIAAPSALLRYVLLLSAMIGTIVLGGCISNNDTSATGAQWTLVYAGGGITGGEFAVDHDGITLGRDYITYFSGREVIRTLPVTHTDGVSVFTGEVVHLLVIAGAHYVKRVDSLGRLHLDANAFDGAGYLYTRPIAN